MLCREDDHSAGSQGLLCAVEVGEEQLSLRLRLGRCPPEDDLARPRMAPDSQQLPEVRVRRHQDPVSTRCRLQDSEIVRAEEVEVTHVDCVRRAPTRRGPPRRAVKATSRRETSLSSAKR